jgi:arabinofuranan 3-O-arabinosyltransferase
LHPPIFLLALVPFAVLPYFTAFFTWNFVTLLGCVAVVLFIVRSPAAIAVMLAWPFAAWNFLAGQNGFFTASLLGAALLLLKRHPVLAGVFVGCLTYKPQFGILIPVALAAGREWRAFASATATAMLLVGASVAAFGTAVWERFPEELIAQANDALFIDPQTAAQSSFGIIQTVYGLIRYLNLLNGPILAWIAQGATTCGIAFVVWLVWRSGVRYPLKAATLSAGALLATPYSHAYDMAALVIPVAFLAIDQMRCGLLRGEQTIAIALFGVSFSVFPTFGRLPIGPLITLSLLFLILRRIFCDARRSTAAFG